MITISLICAAIAISIVVGLNLAYPIAIQSEDEPLNILYPLEGIE